MTRAPSARAEHGRRKSANRDDVSRMPVRRHVNECPRPGEWNGEVTGTMPRSSRAVLESVGRCPQSDLVRGTRSASRMYGEARENV